MIWVFSLLVALGYMIFKLGAYYVLVSFFTVMLKIMVALIAVTIFIFLMRRIFRGGF
jgi:hypothetical protein